MNLCASVSSVVQKDLPQFPLSIVLGQPVELALGQLEVARHAHELDVNRVAANHRVQSNGVRIRNLIAHREEERAVARDVESLPDGSGVRRPCWACSGNSRVDSAARRAGPTC